MWSLGRLRSKCMIAAGQWLAHHCCWAFARAILTAGLSLACLSVLGLCSQKNKIRIRHSHMMHCQSKVIWLVNYCQPFVESVTHHSLRDVLIRACQVANSDSQPLWHQSCNHGFGCLSQKAGGTIVYVRTFLLCSDKFAFNHDGLRKIICDLRVAAR